MRRDPRAWFACALALAVASACATPVGVDRVDPRSVHRELNRSVISGDQPSAPTEEFLTRMNLREAYRRNPDETLETLHRGLAPSGDMDRLYALAELSFLRAAQTRRSDQALASALYAYAFLFDPASPKIDRFDPRIQVVRNLYNFGLTRGLAASTRGKVELASARHTLPFGTLDVAMAPGATVWAGFQLQDFAAVADFRVRGLDNRYRQAGIGAPLAAALGEPLGAPPVSVARVARRLRVPVTAFLRVPDPRAQIASGQITGTLEVHSEEERPELIVNGEVVPLEVERSSSLAFMLEGAPVWDFGFQGFRLGDFLPTGQPDQLIFLRPYQPDRIPLVLVHGTFSSPATWAQLVNELENDPEISRTYQPWLFIYNSGNPIAYSAGILAESLRNVVHDLDPEGRNPTLRDMVIVGHSQGGLLTKLMAVESGDVFWRNVARRPITEVNLRPESRLLLERSLFYEPLPFVKRVVFMSTPHHGSFLSDFRVASWLSRLVKLPATLTKLTLDLATEGNDAFFLSALNRKPTSLDNMASNNRFLQELSALPIAPGIASNSIIAVRGNGPYQEGNDGVVRYTSAHIEGVESEKVVQPSGHSVQMTQPGIQELRRILIDHAQRAELQAVAGPASP